MNITNEVLRLVRTGVQAAVTAAVTMLGIWVVERTGYEVNTEEIIAWLVPLALAVIMPVVTGAVAQIEKVVPVVGLLNGPRRKVEYSDPS